MTPAAVKTAIFDQMSQSHIDFMLSKIPMGRFGAIDEVVALISWLASEECSFSTGAVFDVSVDARPTEARPRAEIDTRHGTPSCLASCQEGQELGDGDEIGGVRGVGDWNFWYPAFAAPAQPKRLDIDAVNNAVGPRLP